MNNLMKLLKNISLKSNTIQVVLGIVLIISLSVVLLNPYNKLAVLTATTSGGLINAMFGVNMMKDPKRKSTGMSYVLIGIIMIGLGFYLIQYVKK